MTTEIQKTKTVDLNDQAQKNLPATHTLDPIAYEAVGEIVAKDLRKAEVFKRFKIDFCCGGKKTLIEACKDAEADVSLVIEELKHASETPYSPLHNYSDWSLDFLADYIYNIHHKYVRQNAAEIQMLAVKVANHHGDNQPQLKVLAENLQSFFDDMNSHMAKEETLLFPYIKRLVELKGAPFAGTRFPLSSMKSPVKIMEQEHEDAGDELREFRQLTTDYKLPASACNSYKLLFVKIQEFENDLFQHIHLENNILFPKALQLEEELAA